MCPIGNKDVATVKQLAAAVVVPEFVPRKGVKIAADEKEAAKEREALMAAGAAGPEFEALMGKLPPPKTLVGFRVTPLDFEKDDDSNGHMDFIRATYVQISVYTLWKTFILAT